uniref:Uncharacterized protein n=1 Tax=Oryza glumipatula TaxID=40148 RepID=A0A0E0B9V1_9ORYZ
MVGTTDSWGRPIRCRQRPRAAGAMDLTPAMSVGGGAYDPTPTRLRAVDRTLRRRVTGSGAGISDRM